MWSKKWSKKWSVTFELKTSLSHKEKACFKGLQYPKSFLSSSSPYTMSYMDETHILDFALVKAFLPFSLRLQGTKRD